MTETESELTKVEDTHGVQCLVFSRDGEDEID